MIAVASIDDISFYSWRQARGCCATYFDAALARSMRAFADVAAWAAALHCSLSRFSRFPISHISFTALLCHDCRISARMLDTDSVTSMHFICRLIPPLPAERYVARTRI